MALGQVFVLVLQTRAILLLFVSSLSTPFDLPSLLSKIVFPSQLSYAVSNFTTVSERLSEDGVVLDYTYDQTLTSALRQQFPDLIVMWSVVPSFYGSGVSDSGEIFSHYIQALQFTRVIVISDSKPSNIQISKFLVSSHPSVFEEMHIIPLNAGEDFCLQFIGQLIKPSGANLFTIVTDAVAALNLLKAFEMKKLDKEGYAYVLSDQASYYQNLAGNNTTGLLSTGVLYVAEATSALAGSLEDAAMLQLAPVLEKFGTGYLDVNTAFNKTAVLVNVVNSVPRIVATKPEEVGLNIVFPGNATIVPTRSIAVIQTSVNYEFLDSTGYILPSSRIVMRGVQVAFEETNNSTTIIPNFLVNDYSLSLSGETFNYTFTKTLVEQHLIHIGGIHFPVPSGANIIGTFQIFKELNITKPMSMGSGISALAVPADFPLFVRAKIGNEYTALVMARMFSFFGWKRVAVLYSEDQGDNQDFYNVFMSFTSTFGINITNDERMRGLLPDLSVPTAALNASISEIRNSTVRIIVILHNYIFNIMEAMYDLGVRSEYVICTWYGFSYPIFAGRGFSYYKRRVVGKGGLQFYPTPFIGVQGAKVLAYLKAWDGLSYYPNTCYFYDCAMLYMYSTDYMLSRGIDYEDSQNIITAMRGTRFTGCSGTIEIAPGSNDRTAAQFSVMNVKYFESNDSVVLEDVMYYNPFSSTLYQQIAPFMWPDNSTTGFPDTFISTFHCPFLEKETRNFPPGVALGFSISFGICLFTGLLCILIWKRWWNVWHPLLQASYEISADDLMQLVAVPMEFFQFAAAGPNAAYLSYTLNAICASTAMELTTVIDCGGIYWNIVNGVLGCLGLYVVLCVLKLTGIEKKLECLPLVSFLLLWTDLALPTFSNLLFFPIVTILSNVFLCYKSVGLDFSSSYLNIDCFHFCWSGSHIMYVVFCSIALLAYIPLGIFAKPLWQEMQPNLHIRAQPPSLIVKSFVQVLLMTLWHTLKSDYPGLHAGLYFGLLVVYIAFLIGFQQYNYGR